jgi:hypothetical protein
MDQQLLDFIRTLSINDKKTLIGKALKSAEECGELAKAVLPFENAPGTTHRFIEKNKILQECVDLMLTAMSIVYDLGYSDEELFSMMEKSLLNGLNCSQKSKRLKLQFLMKCMSQ